MVYRIARKFGGEFHLADWWINKRTANFSHGIIPIAKMEIFLAIPASKGLSLSREKAKEAKAGVKQISHCHLVSFPDCSGAEYSLATFGTIPGLHYYS